MLALRRDGDYFPTCAEKSESWSAAPDALQSVGKSPKQLHARVEILERNAASGAGKTGFSNTLLPPV
jgi:hypothetical protein